MKKYLLMAFAFLLIGSVAFAATDSVMIVTDKAAVDSSVAGAAASKAGIPVLVAENGMLTDTLKATIKEIGATTVILVGGPVVIKPETETGLRALGYKVIRLWGVERTGTAVAIAKYFWPEGASCAVLVTDTKNDNNDAGRQRAASNLASRMNCTLIPIPEGTLPADVIATVEGLNVNHVFFVGKNRMAEIREKFKNHNITEIEGNDDEIENEISDRVVNGTKKLVVVAVPDWRTAVAASSHRSDDSVVKQISSVNEVQGIIDFIKEYNITNVRVVGMPPLADDVEAKLKEAGINVTKMSGQKAEDIVRNAVRELKDEWDAKRLAEKMHRQKVMSKIRNDINGELNDTGNELNAAATETSSMSGTDATALAQVVDDAQAKLSQVKSLLQIGNYDEAKRLLAEIKYNYRSERYEKKDRLNVDISKDQAQEEGSLDAIAQSTNSEIARADNDVSDVKSRCSNSEAAQAVVAKAKLLRDEMKSAQDAGDFEKAANLQQKIKELLRVSNGLSNSCREKGVISRSNIQIVKDMGVVVPASSTTPLIGGTETEVDDTNAGSGVSGGQSTGTGNG